jgi:hypothetical protein
MTNGIFRRKETKAFKIFIKKNDRIPTMSELGRQTKLCMKKHR